MRVFCRLIRSQVKARREAQMNDHLQSPAMAGAAGVPPAQIEHGHIRGFVNGQV